MLDDRTGSDYDGAVQPDEEWAEFVDTNVVDGKPVAKTAQIKSLSGV